MQAVLAPDLVGSCISHYSIQGLLGIGGAGEVYHARDKRLRRDVAIKVLRHDAMRCECDGRTLRQEARALSRVNHPHIATIYDLFAESGRDFIVMELVSGSTLKDILSGGALPMDEVLRIGVQIAQGLVAVHAAGVIHCDIKPANIKITASGHVKILDFGLARVTADDVCSDTVTLSTTGLQVAGTVPYMSPERLRGEPPDERGDLFSAGAVLYEMASGERAFPQRHVGAVINAVLNEHPAPLLPRHPLVPPAFASVVKKALQKRAQRRFASANELVTALVEVEPLNRFSSWVSWLR